MESKSGLRAEATDRITQVGILGIISNPEDSKTNIRSFTFSTTSQQSPSSSKGSLVYEYYPAHLIHLLPALILFILHLIEYKPLKATVAERGSGEQPGASNLCVTHEHVDSAFGTTGWRR